MAKVSVIVPVYGVEKLIERCATTLFSQTLDDIEYLFINDATKDNSIEVLNTVADRFPKRKKNIRIINLEENRGQAYVRYFGLSIATGDYVIHCDSDDWVDVDIYQNMYSLAVERDADCVICDYYLSDGAQNTDVIKEGASGNLFHDLITHKISFALWNKLYKRSLFDNNTFIAPTGNVGEDMIINLNLAHRVTKVAYLDKPMYYYYENTGSISRASEKESILRRFYESQKNVTVLKLFFERYNLSNQYKNELVVLQSLKREWLGPLLRDKDVYSLWWSTFPEINRRLLWGPKIPFKRKIKYILHLLRFPV